MSEHPNEALDLVERAASQALAPPPGYRWRKPVPVYGLHKDQLTPEEQLWLHYCVKHQLMARFIRIADGASGGYKHEYVFGVTDDGRLSLKMREQQPAAEAVDEIEEPEPTAIGVTWQDVAERMERLRQQGEPFTSQHKLADLFGCSSGTIHKAIENMPSLKPWSESKRRATPKAQSINPVVTDNAKQSRELNPEDDAAIREYIEHADEKTKGWFLALPLDMQLAVVNDPDQHRRILGRKP